MACSLRSGSVLPERRDIGRHNVTRAIGHEASDASAGLRRALRASLAKRPPLKVVDVWLWMGTDVRLFTSRALFAGRMHPNSTIAALGGSRRRS